MISEEEVTLYGQKIKRPHGMKADNFTSFWRFFYQVLKKRGTMQKVRDDLDRAALEPMEMFRRMVERG